MRKILIPFLIICFAILPQAIDKSFAQTTTPSSTRAQIKITIQENRMENLRTRADNEIDRRIASLNNILNILTNAKHLNSDQVSALNASIQTEVNDLNTLKSKIDADTDITTLRTDVQSIVKDYRVYLLFIPKVHILSAADKILNLTDLLNAADSGLIAKLQSRINDAKNAGHDTTSLQNTLTDLQNKVNDAVSQANNAISTVTPLTPDGYPGNKTTLTSARTMIKTAMTDLQTVRTDAKTIIQELRSFGSVVSPTTTQ